MALNQAALEELRSLDPDGSTGLLARIITTYLDDASALLRQINSALAAGDCASLARHAHSLKSTSMSLGAAQVGALAREIELAGNNKELANCTALLDALTVECAAAEQLLRAEIAPPQP